MLEALSLGLTPGLMILLRCGPESPTPNRDQGCLGMSGGSDSGPSLGNSRRFASAPKCRRRPGPDSFPALRLRRSNRVASFLVGERSLAKGDDCRRVLSGRNRIAIGFLPDYYFVLNGSCHPECTDSVGSCSSIRRAKYRGQHRCRPLHMISVKNDRKAQKGSQERTPQKQGSALQFANLSRVCRRLTGDRHEFLAG
jgi:hypothetical protein